MMAVEVYDPMEASHWVMEALRKNYRCMEPVMRSRVRVSLRGV